MDQQKQDIRLETVVNELSDFAGKEHLKNKKRVKAGAITMVLLPVILGFIRWMTDSDKVLFLIIWVFCVFVVAIYLIGTEYYDHTLQKSISRISRGEEVSDEEE